MVLDEVSLEVGVGEIVTIVGESGAGKTTVVRALLGSLADGLRIEQGTVEVLGHRIVGDGAANNVSVTDLRRRIGFLGQDPASTLCPTRRIGAQLADVVGLNRDGAAGADRVAEALRAVQLPDDRAFRRRFPHQLSGGQQQRVALARAIVNRPTLVILDEPTTGLDTITSQLVMGETHRLQRAFGFALVTVTHDLARAAALGRNDGRDAPWANR